MAVCVRLKRIGSKKAPRYRIVVTDKNSPRDGRCIEELGSYDPTKKPSFVQLDKERAAYWLTNGAQTTITVKNIFKKQGITSTKK